MVVVVAVVVGAEVELVPVFGVGDVHEDEETLMMVAVLSSIPLIFQTTPGNLSCIHV